MSRTTIKTCSVPGCPNLTTSGKCEDHARVARAAQDARRGSSSERGYDTRHRRIRGRVAREVAAGRAVCARCNRAILPGQPWDLDHDDEDRSRYLGPSHASCNRASKTHAKERRGA